MNADIEAILEWAKVNGAKLNPSKTQLILLGRRRNLPKISTHSIDPVLLHGIPIPFADSVKNLGVLMDQFMTGDLWAKQVCRRALVLQMWRTLSSLESAPCSGQRPSRVVRSLSVCMYKGESVRGEVLMGLEY